MRSAYLDYAMSVIVGRALPDVRDGLKPVHRRVLFAMNEMGLQPNRPLRQVRPHRRRRDGQVPPARRLGDLRHARAHGAGLLAAPPAGRRPGQLRLGRRRSRGRHAVHGGPARRRIAREMLRDLDADTVDFQPNYDGENSEPTVLPSRFPNLLVNGSSGIAVGMATNIPPHNLREVIAATDRLHRRPGHRHRRPDAAHQGPGLPDRRRDPRPVGHPRGVRDRPRPRPRARPRPLRAARRTARRRSSSPSCPTRSRRAATAASSARSPSSCTRRRSPRSPTCATSRTATACGS